MDLEDDDAGRFDGKDDPLPAVEKPAARRVMHAGFQGEWAALVVAGMPHCGAVRRRRA